jgi:TonB family protein
LKFDLPDVVAETGSIRDAFSEGIVTGIALDKVTTVHPTPQYPRVALALGIDGKVQIEVKVHNGRIAEADVLSGAPMASSAKTWIVGNWKFKPEVSGLFTVPINYKRQA